MRTSLISVFITISILSITAVKRFHSVGGPYKLVFKRVTPCPAMKDQAKEFAVISVHDFRSRTGAYIRVTGNVSMPYVFSDDSFGGRVVLASWNNIRGWQDNAFIFNFKEVCKALDLFGSDLWRGLQRSAMGVATGCPVLPGIYRFSNVTMNMSKVPIKEFIYGKWRADGRIITRQGQIAACVQAIVDTVPV